MEIVQCLTGTRAVYRGFGIAMAIVEFKELRESTREVIAETMAQVIDKRVTVTKMSKQKTRPMPSNTPVKPMRPR